MHYSTLRIVFAKIIMKTLDNKYQTVFRAKWLYQNVHRLQIQSVKSYSSEPCFSAKRSLDQLARTKRFAGKKCSIRAIKDAVMAGSKKYQSNLIHKSIQD